MAIHPRHVVVDKLGEKARAGVAAEERKKQAGQSLRNAPNAMTLRELEPRRDYSGERFANGIPQTV